MPVTGRNVPVTGRNVSVTGRNVSVTGRNVPVTGRDVPVTSHEDYVPVTCWRSPRNAHFNTRKVSSTDDGLIRANPNAASLSWSPVPSSNARHSVCPQLSVFFPLTSTEVSVYICDIY